MTSVDSPSSVTSLSLFPSPQKRPKRQDSHIDGFEATTPAPTKNVIEKPTSAHRVLLQVKAQDARAPAESPKQPNTARAPFQRSIPAIARSGHNKTASPASSPEHRRVASPALSDIRSARSGSPTLVRSNSQATSNRTLVDQSDLPPMQSIFPQYDHRLPLSQQQYLPTQSSPEHIPKDKISKPPYSPTYFAGSPSISTSPYFTPATELKHLWDAANGKSNASAPQRFTLQMHRSADSSQSCKSEAKESRILFGQSPSQPFYSVAQHQNPSERSNGQDTHELLLLRHHPKKGTRLPVAHLTLTRPSPSPTPPIAPQTPPEPSWPLPAHPLGQAPPSTHITTIFPKLAALRALESAANSPTASDLALLDPKATSPAAARLAESAVREAEERESCQLRRTLPDGGNRSGNAKYVLQHPRLGTLPVKVQGDVGRGLQAQAQVQEPKARGNGKAARIALLRPAVSWPSLSSAPDAHVNATAMASTAAEDDADELASLDFMAGALTLDVKAMQALDAPFLVDVAASALLAVAVAEAEWGREGEPELVFAGPPAGDGAKKHEKGKVNGKGRVVGKRKEKRKKMEMEGDGEELPKITRGILRVLGWSLRTVVWVLELGVKAVVGLVLGVSRCVSKA